ncbi:MAG: PKD domain-containing protein [Bacteroidetes bacterium]|nr:PKD domain-containing protein [Bacteroidota bacterium]
MLLNLTPRGSQKSVGLFLFFLILLSGEIFAQSSGTPQWYTAVSAGSDNAFPLFSGTNKIQCIYAPDSISDDGTASGKTANAGIVTYVYVKLGVILAPSLTFGDFTVKLGQNIDTASQWNSTKWDTSLTTVFYSKSFSLSYTLAQKWLKIPLQTAFKYDPSKSLVFELSVSSGSGAFVHGDNAAKNVGVYGASSSSSPTSMGKFRPHFGLDIEPPKNNNAGVSKLISPIAFCSGTYDIEVEIVNNGGNPIDSVRVNWSVNDTLQKTIYYSKTVDITGSKTGNTAIVKLGSRYFPKDVQHDVKVWTSKPNGVNDTITSDDSLHLILKTAMNGKYTIGGSKADFKNPVDAAKELSEFGICGSVELLINPGKYSGSVRFDRVAGTSAQNTLLVHGTNRDSVWIQQKATSNADHQNILIQGTNYITIKNLTLDVQDSLYGIGVHIVNSSFNTIDSCRIIMPENSTSIKLFGIAASGAAWEALTTGYSGDSNRIAHCHISGGYYGAVMSGNTPFQTETGNVFEYNRIENFFRYGLYFLAEEGFVIDHNYIKTNRDPNSYGITMDACAGFTLNANYIHAAYYGIYNRLGNYYVHNGVNAKITNNMVISTGTFEATFRAYYAKHMEIYHNSFLSDSGATTLELQIVDSSKILNNIFSNRGYRGQVITLSSTTFTTDFPLDYNLYETRTVDPPVVDGTIYNSFSSWFTAVTGINAHSVNQDPQFISSKDLHLKYGSRPSGVQLKIKTDFDDELRCLAHPTIGAHEMLPGVYPDTLNPIKMCVGDSLGFTISTLGHPLSTYGTDWEIINVSLIDRAGKEADHYKLITPTSSSNGWIYFQPEKVEANRAFYFSWVISELGGDYCYTKYSYYVEVYDTFNNSFNLDKNSICLGDTIRFVNSADTSQQLTYKWDLGDGNTKTLRDSFNYVYKLPGSYSVKLTAGNSGCSRTITKKVDVGKTQGAAFAKGMNFNGKYNSGTRNDPDQVCSRDSNEYFILPPQGLSSAQYGISWSVASVEIRDDQNQLYNQFVNVPADSANDYRIKIYSRVANRPDTLHVVVQVQSLQATSCVTSIDRYVEIRTKPTVVFGVKNLCVGKWPVEFYDSSYVDYGSMNSFWDFGDGGKVNSFDVTHQYSDTGTFTVTHAITASDGCTDEIKRTISVDHGPGADFKFSESCLDSVVMFTNLSDTFGEVTSHKWLFGDGNAQFTTHGYNAYHDTFAFNALLIETLPSGCSDSVLKIVRVYPKPVAQFQIPDFVCPNEPAVFYGNANVKSGGRWYWDFGNNDTSNALNPVKTFSKADTLSVAFRTVQPYESCSSDTSAQFIIHSNPAVNFTVTHLSQVKKEFIPDDTVGMSFNWYFGDGDSSKDHQPVHTYSKSGSYYAKMIATNQWGCFSEVWDSVTVGNIGIKTLESFADSRLKVFPNPVNGSATIYFESESEGFIHLKLTNAIGQEITVFKGSGNKGGNLWKINSNDLGLTQGIYLLILETESGKGAVRVLVE